MKSKSEKMLIAAKPSQKVKESGGVVKEGFLSKAKRLLKKRLRMK